MMYVCEICGKEFNNGQKFGGHLSGHVRAGKRRKKSSSYGFCRCCDKELTKHQKLYCSHSCQIAYQQLKWEEKWLNYDKDIIYNKEYKFWTNVRLKNALFKKYNKKCARCGWGEINPFTQKIPLEIEHIDGNFRNNSPDNVILLCPNCHSLTKTYKGANKGHGRKSRK